MTSAAPSFRYQDARFEERLTTGEWRPITLKDVFNLRNFYRDSAAWNWQRGHTQAREEARTYAEQLSDCITDYVQHADRMTAEIMEASQ